MTVKANPADRALTFVAEHNPDLFVAELLAQPGPARGTRHDSVGARANLAFE